MSVYYQQVEDHVVFGPKHCPECGGELDSDDSCVDCKFSIETALTSSEAREYTLAGD